MATKKAPAKPAAVKKTAGKASSAKGAGMGKTAPGKKAGPDDEDGPGKGGADIVRKK